MKRRRSYQSLPRNTRRKTRFRRKSTVRRLPRNSVGPTGDRFQAKLKYISQKTLTSGAAMASTTYNLGSLFDPDYTGAGSQPAGFDELMSLYTKYHVNAVKIHLTWSAANSTAAANHFLIGYAAAPGLVSVTIPQELGLLNFGRVNQVYIDGAGRNNAKMYLKLSKVMGVPPSEYYEGAEYEGNSTSNPSLWPSFTVGVINVDGITATSVHFLVRFTFYSEFRKPVQLGYS